jgi:hypothetical protein
MDDSARCRMGDPQCIMRRCVAQFRAVVAKYPNDSSISELIDELRTNSSEFRSLWAEHDVLGSTEGLKRFVHPDVGELILDHIGFALPGDGDMRMTVLTAAPGSESERKLHALWVNRYGPLSIVKPSGVPTAPFAPETLVAV